MAEIRVQPKPRSRAWLWLLLALAVVALVAWYVTSRGLVGVRDVSLAPASVDPTLAVVLAAAPAGAPGRG